MGSHQKGFLKLKCLSPLKMLTSPLFEETLGAFLSHPVSFFLLRLLKTSFQMASIYWRWTHILEWSYARQHG
jgi:hypothetical protein